MQADCSGPVAAHSLSPGEQQAQLLSLADEASALLGSELRDHVAAATASLRGVSLADMEPGTTAAALACIKDIVAGTLEQLQCPQGGPAPQLMQVVVRLVSRSAGWLACCKPRLQAHWAALCSALEPFLAQLLSLASQAFCSLHWHLAAGAQAFGELMAELRDSLKELVGLVCEGLAAALAASGAGPAALGAKELAACRALFLAAYHGLLRLGLRAWSAVGGLDACSSAAAAACKAPPLQGSALKELPREMKPIGYTMLNASWVGVVKLLTCLPKPMMASSGLLSDEAAGGAGCGGGGSGQVDVALRLCCEAMQAWLAQQAAVSGKAQDEDARSRPARFWTNYIAKLSGIFPDACSRCWQDISQLALAVFQAIGPASSSAAAPASSPGAAPAQSAQCAPARQLAAILQEHVAPKLVSALAVALDSAPADQLPIRLQLLAQPSCGGWLLAHARLATAMLAKSSLLTAPAAKAACARHLVPWLVKVHSVEAYSEWAQAAGSDVAGGGGDFAAAVQSSLVALAACAASAEGGGAEAVDDCLCSLYQLVVAQPQQPLLQRTVADIVCAVLLHAEDGYCQQQLHLVAHLLECTSASEVCQAARSSEQALPAIALCPRSAALAKLLSAMLCAAKPAACQQLYRSCCSADQVAAITLNPCTAAAAVFMWHAFAPSGGRMAEAADVGERVLGLLEAVGALHNNWAAACGDASPAYACALLQSQLFWLLSGLHASTRHVEQLAQGGAALPPSLADAITATSCLAADIVLAAKQVASSGGSGGGANRQRSTPPGHALPALQILSSTVGRLPAATAAAVVAELAAWQGDATCAPHVAALCSGLGAMRPPPSALFQAALDHPHWAVLHEAVQALVSYSRTALDPDLRALLPPSLLDHGAVLEPFGRLFKSYLAHAPEGLQPAAHAPALCAEGAHLLRQWEEAADGSGATERMRALSEAICWWESCSAAQPPSDSAPMQMDISVPPSAAQPAGASPFTAGLADNRKCVAALLTAVSNAERSVNEVVGLMRSQGPRGLSADVYTQLRAHGTYLRGELASVSSHIRSLQSAVDCMRE